MRIPELHANKSLDDMVGEGWLEALSKLRERLSKGSIVAIIGGQGTGKTQLAIEATRGSRAEYAPFRSLGAEIRSTFKPDCANSDYAIVKRYSESAQLVLDDCHAKPPSDFERSFLLTIADARYRSRLPMVMIYADTGIAGFEKFAGPDVMRRVKESGGIIAADWRPILHDEIAPTVTKARPVTDMTTAPDDFEEFFREVYLSRYPDDSPVHAKWTSEMIADKWFGSEVRRDYERIWKP